MMSRLPSASPVFFFNDTATTEIYTLSLHDALPIYPTGQLLLRLRHQPAHAGELPDLVARAAAARVEHQEHGIEAALGLPHRRDHRLGDVVVRVRPGVDHLVVALPERDLARRVRALE